MTIENENYIVTAQEFDTKANAIKQLTADIMQLSVELSSKTELGVVIKYDGPKNLLHLTISESRGDKNVIVAQSKVNMVLRPTSSEDMNMLEDNLIFRLMAVKSILKIFVSIGDIDFTYIEKDASF